MTYRLRNILLAVGLAGMAAALTSFYVANYKRNVQRGENNVTVWVAKSDIAPGTTGRELMDGGLVSKSVIKRTVVPGAISDPEQIEKLVATERTYANEQVSLSRFHSVRENGIRADLRGNMRGLQIAGDPNQLLAGTLKKGDRVDVVASMKYKVSQVTGNGGSAGDLDRTAARVVLRDLLVLRAPDRNVASAELASSTQTASAQLAVTDSQAQKLFFVMKNAEWTLQVRPVVEAEDSPESVETIESVLGDGLKTNQYRQLYAGRNR